MPAKKGYHRNYTTEPQRVTLHYHLYPIRRQPIWLFKAAVNLETLPNHGALAIVSCIGRGMQP